MRRFLSLFTIILFLTLSAFGNEVLKPTLELKSRELRFKAALSEALSSDATFNFSVRNASGGKQLELSRSFSKGTKSISFERSFQRDISVDEVIWSRLFITRTIGSQEVTDVFAFSELIPDLFELTALGSEYISSGSAYAVAIRSFHPVSTRPVPNVSIVASIDFPEEYEVEPIQSEINTDDSGYGVLVFQIPDEVVFEDYDDVELKIKGSLKSWNYEIEEDIDTKETKPKLLITTDKQLYQPGQDVYMRTLALRSKGEFGNGAPISNTLVRFKVTDDKNKTVFQESVESNRFGVCSVKWRVPDNAKTGNYVLEVSADGFEETKYKFLKVSRYELPEFLVEVKTNKEFYLPKDEEAEIKIDASYLYGKKVDQGRVEISDVLGNVIAKGATDKDGLFKESISLREYALERAGDNSDSPNFTDFEFSAAFTDVTTNKTEERRFDLRLSKEPVHLYTPNFEVRSGISIKFYVVANKADGLPAQTEIVVSGRLSKTDRGPRELFKARTNEYGVALVEIPFPDCSECLLEETELTVTARKGQNVLGRITRDFYPDREQDEIRVTTDKFINQSGDDLVVKLESTLSDREVFVRAFNSSHSAFADHVSLRNGKGSVTIPYSKKLEGVVTLRADTSEDGDGVDDAVRVVYPNENELEIKSVTSADTFRPAERVSVEYEVSKPDRTKGESVIGLFAVDSAVEQQARIINDGVIRNPLEDYNEVLGKTNKLAGKSVADLESATRSTKNVSDLETIAPLILGKPRGDNTLLTGRMRSAENAYRTWFRRTLGPIEIALQKRFQNDDFIPKDRSEYEAVLGESSLDVTKILDPWGMPYRLRFEPVKENEVLFLISNGPNKTKESDESGKPINDDIIARSILFPTFQKARATIETILREHRTRFPEEQITSKKSLLKLLAKNDFDFSRLKDRWGRPYEIEFGVEQRNSTIRIYSRGEDLKNRNDDFTVFRYEKPFFRHVYQKIERIIREHNRETGTFPDSKNAFKKVLRKGGVNFDRLRGPFGRKLYLEIRKSEIDTERVEFETVKSADGKTEEKFVIIPIRRKSAEIFIRSRRSDGKKTSDWEYMLGYFRGVVSEKDRKEKRVSLSKDVLRNGSSAVIGTVKDPDGIPIPEAVVVISGRNGQSRTTKTDMDGNYILGSIPAGKYELTAEVSGFQRFRVSNLYLRKGQITKIPIALRIAGASMTVDVIATTISTVINLSDTKIDTSFSAEQILSLPINIRGPLDLVKLQPGVASKILGTGLMIDGADVSDQVIDSPKNAETVKQETRTLGTPRVRDYFPETLLWIPSVVTSKEGKTRISFKLADNITTWKFYAVASDAEGRLGISSTEIKAFQPFFVDASPPKTLTVGDEIRLPVQVRNFTDSSKKVDVRLFDEKWLQILDRSIGKSLSGIDEPFVSKNVAIEPEKSENAIFSFKASRATEKGDFRVAAKSAYELDSVSKPVKVLPNGHLVSKQSTKTFSDRTDFELTIPEDAIDDGQRSEIKIYPSLNSHVAESIEGILKRPNGCGEQTISSTFPHLLMLELTEDDDAKRSTYRANLQRGYQRLIGYQVANGGFSYWGGDDDADLALTAYALDFLTSATPFIEVDKSVIDRAADFVISSQKADGSWQAKRSFSPRNRALSAYIVSVLSAKKSSLKDEKLKDVVNDAIAFLRVNESDVAEPYTLANTGLALVELGRKEEAKRIQAKLESAGQTSAYGVFWKSDVKTPFLGWGTAGRVETTAIVLSFLKSINNEGDISGLFNQGLDYLFSTKDQHGVWHSTQSTIRVVRLLSSKNKAQSKDNNIEIRSGGRLIKTIRIDAQKGIKPVSVSLDEFLKSGTTDIEVSSNSNESLQAQLIYEYYLPWDSYSSSSEARDEDFDFSLTCDDYQVRVQETVSCETRLKSKIYSSRTMLLAEIGIPPGADVDRRHLRKVVGENYHLSQFEIMPDRIVFYIWSGQDEINFDIKFKPRYGINALAPRSIVYDYYNEESRAVVKPQRFIVR